MKSFKTFKESFGIYEGTNVPLEQPMLEEKEPELNKPKRSGGPTKYVVYVRDPSTGNVKKINFGDKKAGFHQKLTIKSS